MSDLDRIALDRAVSSGGVLTRDEALGLGYTPRMIDGRVARGRWSIVARGVYRLAEPSDRRNLLRSVLASWPGAVASHESAAVIHGFPYVKSTDVVASHHSRTTHRFPGVEIRRTHDLDAWHVTSVDGMRVTTIARTIVDLAGSRGPGLMGRIIDGLVADGRVELFEIEAVVESVARRGKPGMRTMRAALATRVGESHSGSVLEQRGRRVLADACLPAPVAEYPIPWSIGRRFDDAYPEAQLAIEWDSRKYHGQLAAFEADRARDRDAAINGWTVLRFTWDDVTNHPDRIVESVTRLLDR